MFVASHGRSAQPFSPASPVRFAAGHGRDPGLQIGSVMPSAALRGARVTRMDRQHPERPGGHPLPAGIAQLAGSANACSARSLASSQRPAWARQWACSTWGQRRNAFHRSRRTAAMLCSAACWPLVAARRAASSGPGPPVTTLPGQLFRPGGPRRPTPSGIPPPPGGARGQPGSFPGWRGSRGAVPRGQQTLYSSPGITQIFTGYGNNDRVPGLRASRGPEKVTL